MLLLLGAGVASAQTKETFLGWSADGSFYATTYVNPEGRFASLCKATDERYPTWPKNLGMPGGGARCMSRRC